ncbi:MAG: hypothetical protein E3J87_08490 [Candidatus Cloacimonadota bacterium]|nr:MAG: hypothetical protein E3J87_08490 [Candidatus Cloacimonadota bacterium]
MKRNTTVDIFGVINFALAGLNCLMVLFFILVLIYGIFFSGDTEAEIKNGVIGSIILIGPFLIGFAIYLSAGVGLMKRRVWGYYMHIAASIMAFFSIILIAYTVVSLIFVFKPEFREEFFSNYSK